MNAPRRPVDHAEVARFIDTLQKLTSRDSTTPRAPVQPSAGVNWGTRERAALAWKLYGERRLRAVHFPEMRDIFAEPAWDMLLGIYYHSARGSAVSLNDATDLSCVPATTGSRWISTLVEQGVIDRAAHPQDKRKVNITLAPKTMTALENYLDAVERQNR